MATVSHLPHVIANVLVQQAAAAAAEESERLPEVGPSFRDTTRVAGANPPIWGDIFATNREAVAREVEAVSERLREAAELIRSGDAERVGAWHGAAREHRRRLLEADRVGGELYELRLGVENRPGTVAELALALGRAGVNIEDMALDPAPDMRTGAVSLWVAGRGRGRARGRDRAGAGPQRIRVGAVTRFAPSGPLRGTLRPPPDKSISHRAALIGAMGEGATAIEGYLDAADTRATLDAIQALGARGRGARSGRARPAAATCGCAGSGCAARGSASPPAPSRSRSRWRTPAPCFASCRAGWRGRAAAPGPSTETSRSGAAPWTGSPSRCG